MTSTLAGAWKSAAREARVLRIVLPPFAASKLIGLLVPMLTVWVRGTGAGLPSGSALLSPSPSGTGAPSPRSPSAAIRAGP